MIKSMTGFGRCEIAENNRKFTVEMKSVNHRYLDVNIKMPKKLNFFESAIRSELKDYISRGKVDIFITYEDFSENNTSVRYNREIAEEYLKYLRRMAEDFGLDNDVRVSTSSSSMVNTSGNWMWTRRSSGRSCRRRSEALRRCLCRAVSRRASISGMI